MKDYNCIFCKIIAGIVPATKIFEDEKYFIKHILAFIRWCKFGKTVIRPLFPSLTDDRIFKPVRAVDPPREGITFETHPGIPVRSRLISIEIRVSLMVIILLYPHCYPISDKCLHPAMMGIVRRTNKGKRRIITVLIMINLFPIPVGIVF